jgi:hypothetical protein
VPLFYPALLAVFDFKVAQIPSGRAAIVGDHGFADPAIGSVVAVGK